MKSMSVSENAKPAQSRLSLPSDNLALVSGLIGGGVMLLLGQSDANAGMVGGMLTLAVICAGMIEQHMRPRLLRTDDGQDRSWGQ